jgi:D-tyrosyl-tRNA(Tyr) deacylase
MNLDLNDVDGELLVVSQFTLLANTKKGNRPSYIEAGSPDFAMAMYDKAVLKFRFALQERLKTGKFGANMKVALVNDGPVTLWIDSKNRT